MRHDVRQMSSEVLDRIVMHAKGSYDSEQPYNVAENMGDFGEHILMLADLDLGFRNRSFREESVFAVRQGGRIGGENLSIDARLDAGIVNKVVSGGSSVVFVGLQQYFARVRQAAVAIRNSVGHSVQANAYLTPPSQQALPAHEDPYSVLVLQISGSKNWVLGGENDEENPDNVADSIVLRPGSCLFLRKGTRHVARCTDEHSLHLTFGIRDDSAPLAQEDMIRGPFDLDGDSLLRTLTTLESPST